MVITYDFVVDSSPLRLCRNMKEQRRECSQQGQLGLGGFRLTLHLTIRMVSSDIHCQDDDDACQRCFFGFCVALLLFWLGGSLWSSFLDIRR